MICNFKSTQRFDVARKCGIFGVLVLAAMQPALAVLIPPGGSVNWSPQIVGVPSSINTNRSVIYTNAVSAGCDNTGVADCSAKIQAIFNACPSNEVVYLPAGTYKVAATLNLSRSFVTLRGAGMGQTIISLGNNAPYMGNADWPSPAPSVTITGGATAGSTTVTCNFTTNIVLGHLITITQTNPPTVQYNAALGYGTGPNNCGHDDTRLMALSFYVTGITRNSVTFWPPLPCTLTNAPMITSWAQYIVRGTGIENLTFNLAGGQAGYAVMWNQVYGCWLKNVEVAAAYARQFFIWGAVNCEISGCYTHDSQGSGPNHEGIDFYMNSCWNLCENNICATAGFPEIILGDWAGGCAGNVIDYNYVQNCNSGESIAGWAICDNHGPHNMLNLFEGNVAQSFKSDGYYGSASQDTLFRNYFSGVYDMTQYVWPIAVSLEHWASGFSVLGNVLGQPGYAATYQDTRTGYPSSEAVIFRLGYPNPGNASYAAALSNPTNATFLDLNVSQSITVNGNFDFVNQATLWDTNGPQPLPASLYYTSQPPWWANWGPVAWPPIGPDLTPMVSMIPAQARYFQMPAGQASAAAFVALTGSPTVLLLSNVVTTTTPTTTNPQQTTNPTQNTNQAQAQAQPTAWQLAAPPCLRLSSGNSPPPYCPGTDPSVVEWLRADGGLSFSGSNVITWVADVGQNATQSSVANAPIALMAAQKGHPVLAFDGRSSYLQTTSFPTPLQQPYTIFIVYQWLANPSATNVVYDGIDAINRTFLENNNGQTPPPYVGFNCGSSVSTGVTTNSVWNTLEFQANGAASSFSFNGGPDVTIPGNPGTNRLSGLTLGARYDGAKCASVSIAEIIVVNGLPTNTEAQIFSYLKSRWGTF
jgi:hypothetical protein